MDRKSILWYIHPKFLLRIVTFVNFLLFIDRGIIPGASNEFISFIKNDLNTSTPSLYLGLLQSSFIVGLVIGSTIFGHLVHLYGRFTLTGIGCSIWIVAVFLSGASYLFGSYVCLFLARMLSGVGEASLQVTIPPWIQSISPESEKGAWLAFFYTSVPVGIALGYAYSALVAGSQLGWQWSFYFEGIIMFPFVLFMFKIAPRFPALSVSNNNIDNQSDCLEALIPRSNKHSSIASDSSDAFSSSYDATSPSASPSSTAEDMIENDIIIAGQCDTSSAQIVHKPTFGQEFRIVMSKPIFLCVVLAYAAQTATLIGLSTFGSAFLMGLGYFNTESESSTAFGGLVCISGVIFTPLGGMILDRMMNKSISPAHNMGGNDNNPQYSVADDKDASHTPISATGDSITYNPLINKNNGGAEEDESLDNTYTTTRTTTTHLPITRPSNASSLFNHSRSKNNIHYEESITRRDIEQDDVASQHIDGSNMIKMNKVLKLITISSIIAVFLMCSVYLLNDVYSFMVLILFGCGFLFFCSPAINMALMLSVPEANQSFALAMAVIFMHALGDVPSPVLVGLLKDSLAPDCIGNEDDDGQNTATSEACRDDQSGLLLTILIVDLWLCWCVFFFALAWYLNYYPRSATSIENFFSYYLSKVNYYCCYCTKGNHHRKIKDKDEIASSHKFTINALMDSAVVVVE